MSILNQPASDMTLVDLETGNTERFVELIKRSKLPTILLFYATWSRACLEDVELFEAWSKSDNHKVANFILVNLDQNVGDTLAFLDCINPKTGRPRVCRDYRFDDMQPTVLHFGCAEVPESYAVQRVPHKVVIDEHGVVRRNAENFHWDDVAGLLRHRHEEKLTAETASTATFLFPSIAT